ncbi:MAG: prenyltransferase, partial [Bacteroidales bacterium]
CYYLQKEGGKSSINDLLKACLCFCGLALVVGIVIFIYRGSFILYLSLLTAAIGLSYSGAPFRLSYHGLGELTIGFIFGPLLMTGVYYSACGAWSWSELFISIPVGLLVSNILYTHSILDFEPDRAAGKRTLAVLLMNKKAMLFFSFIFNFFPFLIVGFGILYGFLSPWYSLLFVTFYMACALFYRMCWFVKDPQKIFLPKPWMGPVQQWDKIKEAGIEWFMVRWLLSRNYVTFFCLILILLNIFI